MTTRNERDFVNNEVRNRSECFTTNDSRRQERNDRDGQRIKNRCNAKQERLFKANEAADEIVGREHLLNRSEVNCGD